MAAALEAPPGKGLLRVVSGAQIDAQERDTRTKALADKQDDITLDRLAAHVRQEFSRFRRHRTEKNIDHRIIESLRTYRGEYTPSKLQAIKQFKGSSVYSRISAVKCRGAAALLKDIYLTSKPWEIVPTPEPSVPGDVAASVKQLVDAEAAASMAAGIIPEPGQIEQRQKDLEAAVASAMLNRAKMDAEAADQKLHDILVEGGFEAAMGEFLADLTIFPVAVIKGPTVEMQNRLQWTPEGEMTLQREPVMRFRRVDPYFVYFSPGASNSCDADVIERMPVQRSALSALIGVEGYSETALRAVLAEYKRGGLRDWLDDNDQEHSDLTDTDNRTRNDSGLIDMLQYSGTLPGSILREYGFSSDLVKDEEMEYSCKAWIVGRYTLKIVLNPNPARRHEYFTAAFEPVPGSIYGIGLIETLQDVQDVANASLRALVNNMSISSGPQVVINTDRLDSATNVDDMYPWKRWRVLSDPYANNTEKPVDFFQPGSNAIELLSVYEKMTMIADEVSAIPRYITGSDKVGGAGETASGLAMLMNNASKVMQSVAQTIDRQMMGPLLRTLYNYVMLTDESGILRGDEQILVKGVSVAIQKETDRMRKLEFLQLTSNPVDVQITGIEGRAAMLRDVSRDVAFSDDPIPTISELRDRQAMEQKAQQLSALTGGRAGSQSVANNAPPPGNAPPPRTAVADNKGGL